ncbi:glucocorticoid-induced transcript 1 protein-like [Hordeum vulgare]|uniref:Predicted protein n=1 Tax=Hordeum vulgare subsp. vulgare TaxID=112509 RepID=F2E1R3_HORVV|nr:glucocorticoid-induced transcript 1 protein-like [Hordeum vulgare]KAI5015173.1 hypothetical protein ZWY2020_056563 [Hordeum vulgare]BAK01285.1 predicted protein [Hordeum vulgare subsp. vulgare]
MPKPNPPTPSSPSPLPAPARKSASSRRRQRLLASPKPSSAPTSSSSSASSASSSSASFSFAPFSPAPSPFHHRFLSPLRASAVPFSWEHRPGIPKTPARGAGTRSKSGAPPLPLPPSLFSNNKVVAEYSFGPDGAYSVVPGKARKRKQQRRWPAVTDALTEWLAVLSLYRSCTRSRDSLAASGPPPQPRRCSPA